MITYVTELNTENFKTTIKNNKLVVVDIWTIWCNPCLQLSPIIDEVASEFGEKVLVGKLDADSNGDIIKELGVRNIPTVLVYKDGEIVDKSVGMKSKVDIMNMISKHI